MMKIRSSRTLRTVIPDLIILKLTIVMCHDVHRKSKTRVNNQDLTLLDFDDYKNRQSQWMNTALHLESPPPKYVIKLLLICSFQEYCLTIFFADRDTHKFQALPDAG